MYAEYFSLRCFTAVSAHLLCTVVGSQVGRTNWFAGVHKGGDAVFVLCAVPEGIVTPTSGGVPVAD